ncbi:Glucose-6-phosphate isomerase [Caprobacter fermentans]|uniref:Glucose-6-phosphate isomerase n=1 Tax=Caproicibacter fermentans TaxID=2576756 RepID=A0A6N8I4J2_9FIRM|nr:glucose-6-phosphate isomerase [Caproicibacter fermentans]MVB12878.1 Glucose-6-phosphate isomerase [Caproicibacter fermentans]OCN02362.1 glucose-6-phosphate isomerase [Clostridium sp. W14A]QNK41368.1 glucose-6-phosphate isomerase [Caproicibacter fermentans]
MSVKIDLHHLTGFIDDSEFTAIAPQVRLAQETLSNGTGAGSDFLGWLDLPVKYDREEFSRIRAAADKIRSDSEVFVVIGIGGSYLGARAAIEYLQSQNYNSLKKAGPQIYFAGNSLSPSALSEIMELCGEKDFSINVISKSGTTTEPAVAFRVFRGLLEKKYGKKGAAERIYCTTDRARGTLKQLADREGFETFVVPDDVGGRYSVLTAVGLLPIAVAGADIGELMAGAAEERSELSGDPVSDASCLYAAARNILYRKGKETEILVSYEPRFQMMCEWWKQLCGESEGKNGKGLFPASVVFSTDLHSMGQYIQQGKRNLFETVVLVDEPAADFTIGEDADNADGLNFLSGKKMSFVNQKAFEGTVLAHTDGGVPNLVIRVPDFSEKSLGGLIYFFERSVAVSGYLLGINPFDQPGVESYKKNMFALLGKPGYENEKAVLEARLK